MAIIKAITKYGTVTGVPAENPNHSVFKGIPFAKPPVGDLRFAAPQRPDSWKGELVCDKFSYDCIQRVRPDASVNPNEDCLYLNIYTPAKSAEVRLPVMFWIYGGAFSGGSGSDVEFDGEAINRRDVILVTFNYRCGPLGFFCLPELTEQNGYSGNVGILDQIAALKWVQENITAFGGDPDRVLVHGQSAGGISTRMLLTSPLGKGLFTRAIVQSGGGLNEADLVRSKEDFVSKCRQSLELLNWTVKDLYTKDAMELCEALNQVVKEKIVTDEIGFFQPFVDGYVLSDVPSKCIYEGNYSDIPIICGTVAGDSWMFSRKVLEQLGDNEGYLRGFALSPAQSWARHQQNTQRTPIYTYYMDRTQPDRPDPNRPNNHKPHYGSRTRHSTEISYVFGTLNTRGDGWSDYDIQLSNAITDYWTNFAKTGSPNGGNLPNWPLYTSETTLTMHFGDQGYQAETVIQCEDEEKIVNYVEEHPGMLTSLDEF